MLEMGRQHGFRLRGHNDVRVQIPLSPPKQIKNINFIKQK